VTAAQSDIEMNYGSPITVGNRTAVEWWTTLTNGGVPVTLAGAFILTFDESGLCRTLREYWQFVEGTKMPMKGWGTAVAPENNPWPDSLGFLPIPAKR
jgi:hypothetical protein